MTDPCCTPAPRVADCCCVCSVDSYIHRLSVTSGVQASVHSVRHCVRGFAVEENGKYGIFVVICACFKCVSNIRI
jgi:hypothetical protein